MTHVYLSPHLDDAPLSCGGAIHRQAEAGERVVVVTIFAGDPQTPGGAFSPFALEQHGYWGNPPRPMALRRAEDLAALALLGAEARHLSYADAVYRAGPDGEWLYPDLAALFGDEHPGDPVTADSLTRALGRILEAVQASTAYAPLGAGHHVDHVIAQAAAGRLLAQGWRVVFYEDYPYAEVPGAVEAALAAVDAGRRWSSQRVPLAAADVTAKVDAIAYYRTQLGVLFGGVEAMPSRVWAFAAGRNGARQGLAEQIWWPGDPSGGEEDRLSDG